MTGALQIKKRFFRAPEDESRFDTYLKVTWPISYPSTYNFVYFGAVIVLWLSCIFLCVHAIQNETLERYDNHEIVRVDKCTTVEEDGKEPVKTYTHKSVKRK